jgi:hypothetical protein
MHGYNEENYAEPYPTDELRWQSNTRVVVLPWGGCAIQIPKQEPCLDVILHILRAVYRCEYGLLYRPRGKTYPNSGSLSGRKLGWRPALLNSFLMFFIP